jgi:hypothetical protein
MFPSPPTVGSGVLVAQGLPPLTMLVLLMLGGAVAAEAREANGPPPMNAHAAAAATTHPEARMSFPLIPRVPRTWAAKAMLHERHLGDNASARES